MTGPAVQQARRAPQEALASVAIRERKELRAIVAYQALAVIQAIAEQPDCQGQAVTQVCLARVDRLAEAAQADIRAILVFQDLADIRG